MNNNNKKISELLEKIDTNYQSIKNINKEDVEVKAGLLLSHIRELYDEVLYLKFLNEHKNILNKSEQKNQIKNTTYQPNVEHTESIEGQNDSLEQEVDSVDEDSEHGMEDIASDEPAKQESVSMDLNETLKQEQANLFDRLQKTPISDFKSLIGINEKISYINSLFVGNNNEYNDAINFFNDCNDFQNAQPYLNELKDRYDWSKKEKLADEFTRIVKRKFET